MIKEETAASVMYAVFNDRAYFDAYVMPCGKPAKKLVYWGKAY